jgi:hypothetical protein
VYFRQRHFRDVEVVVVVGGAGGDGGCSTHSKIITHICSRSLDQVVKERNKGRNEERNSFLSVLKQWIWSLGLCATLIELELSIVFNSFPMFFFLLSLVASLYLSLSLVWRRRSCILLVLC